MAEMNQIDERDNNTPKRAGKFTSTHKNVYIFLGIRKDGKTLNRGHALMLHMLTWKCIKHYDSTHESAG